MEKLREPSASKDGLLLLKILNKFYHAQRRNHHRAFYPSMEAGAIGVIRLSGDSSAIEKAALIHLPKIQ